MAADAYGFLAPHKEAFFPKTFRINYGTGGAATTETHELFGDLIRAVAAGAGASARVEGRPASDASRALMP